MATEELSKVSFDPDAADAKAPARDVDRSVPALRRDDFDRNVWCLLGLPVDIADIDQAIAEIDAAVRTGRKHSFVTPNVNWLVRALRDPNARSEVLNADYSLVDGAPLAALARMLGVPIRTRVAGSDLFEALRRRPSYTGRRLKVFFFGGREGAAEAAADTVNAEKGGVEAVGWLNPGFGDVETMSSHDILDRINDADPDFVVVALGAGKGQAWIDRNQADLRAPVIAHLGAVVDFTAGGILRAPELVRKLGLEWAWRIKEEPSLWRRYVQDGLALAKIVVMRAAPQLVSSRSKRAGAVANAALSRAGKATIVQLSGDLLQPSLRPVREAFRQAAAAGTDVILDFGGVSAVDRAFLGLILVLEKHLARQGAKIYTRGAKGPQLAVLQANDMRYPNLAESIEPEAKSVSGSAA